MTAVGKIGLPTKNGLSCISLQMEDNIVKQQANLFSTSGPSTYRMIKDVLSPEVPNDVTFTDIVRSMVGYFQSIPSMIVQHHKFNT